MEIRLLSQSEDFFYTMGPIFMEPNQWSQGKEAYLKPRLIYFSLKIGPLLKDLTESSLLVVTENF